MIKKVTNKTVKITEPELVKCRASKEFQAGVITYTNPNPPPPGMPKWFKAWSETVFEPKMEAQTEFNRAVIKRMDKHWGVGK
ncbi:MAG: hypothetical protein LBM72_01060 [Mycoplasmataceae bacterium]|nr:hypothetical protein [Mycoplasmataceae bacterium]